MTGTIEFAKALQVGEKGRAVQKTNKQTKTRKDNATGKINTEQVKAALLPALERIKHIIRQFRPLYPMYKQCVTVSWEMKEAHKLTERLRDFFLQERKKNVFALENIY